MPSIIKLAMFTPLVRALSVPKLCNGVVSAATGGVFHRMEFARCRAKNDQAGHAQCLMQGISYSLHCSEDPPAKSLVLAQAIKVTPRACREAVLRIYALRQ
jgi:hypothetical protein